MTVEFSNLHKILKDSTRRDILQCLNAKGPLSYVELMELARITNTGRLNYHLKIPRQPDRKTRRRKVRSNRKRPLGDSVA